MKHILTVPLLGALTLLALGATGCTTDPAAESCDDFDHYLATCWAGCGAGWDCEYYYGSLENQTQLDLDDCALCLAEEADYGSCGDCPAPSGGYCLDLMEVALGVSCD